MPLRYLSMALNVQNNMRALITFFFCSLLASKLFSNFENLQMESEIALLMNVETGAVLYEKNAHAQTSPASITKVATALYTLHEIGDDVKVRISPDEGSIATIAPILFFISFFA